MNRVKYFSNNDLSVNFHMDRLIEVLADLNKDNDLVDILEKFNIVKFLNNKLYPKSINDKEIQIINKKLNSQIGVYFNTKSENNIVDLFKKIFSSEFKNDFVFYKADFFNCFEIYKLDSKVQEKTLNKLIADLNIPIFYFLNSDYFYKKYPTVVKNQFIKNQNNVELVLENFSESNKKYYIPKNISKTEMYNIFCSYVNNQNSNLNYLLAIYNGIKGIEKFVLIDSKLKLSAKKNIEKITKDLLNKKDYSSRPKMDLLVTSSKSQFENDNTKFKLLIDQEWLIKNNNPESILNYFTYLNFFFTRNRILGLCSFPNLESSILEQTIYGVNTKNYYRESEAFRIKNFLIIQGFIMYQDVLSDKTGYTVEKLVEYFFDYYCPENFNTNWLPIQLARFSGENKKGVEYTRDLLVSEEQIRKQWKLLVEEGEVNPELFELETTPDIKELPSLLDKKYIYINNNNDEANFIVEILFSDQLTMGYIGEDIDESNFYELIRKHNVKITDFKDYQKINCDKLLEKKIISVRENGEIFTDNKQKIRILILYNIYFFGVVHYYYGINGYTSEYSLINFQMEIEKMIKEKILVYKNSLFAKPESDYLNYLLNDKLFDNSLSIRNKYSHGSVLKDNKEDYGYSLIILILYVIKINEELELRSKIQN